MMSEKEKVKVLRNGQITIPELTRKEKGINTGDVIWISIEKAVMSQPCNTDKKSVDNA